MRVANLGHADLDTTMGYIGDVDFGRRVPQVDVYRAGHEDSNRDGGGAD